MFKQHLVILTLFICIVSTNAFAQNNSKLEPLYSAQFTDKFVIIEVKSNGCTRPEDFTIVARGKGGESYSEIGIVRDKQDRCRRMPQLVTLHLELPGALAVLKEPYKVINLFLSK